MRTFFKLKNGQGQGVIQLKKVRKSPTRLGVRAFQSFSLICESLGMQLIHMFVIMFTGLFCLSILKILSMMFEMNVSTV